MLPHKNSARVASLAASRRPIFLDLYMRYFCYYVEVKIEPQINFFYSDVTQNGVIEDFERIETKGDWIWSRFSTCK